MDPHDAGYMKHLIHDCKAGIRAKKSSRNTLASYFESLQMKISKLLSPQLDTLYRSSRLPALRTDAAAARKPSPRAPGHSKRRTATPTSLSRFLGIGGLASESPAVLVHAGFGMQLLSMRVGEGGSGLSQGRSSEPSPSAELLKYV